MIKKNLMLLAVLFSFGCGNIQNKENGLSDTINNTNSTQSKSKGRRTSASTKLIGIWTDGNSENATFDIRKDSIYYIDQFKSYKYLINQDSIKIYYSDFNYNAKFYFIKDTLVMNSTDGEIAKFWKFKN